MSKGMTTCKVCGRDFAFNEEDHYIARDEKKIANSISAILCDEEPTLYDAFDCPHCGCQHIVQERKRETFSFFDDDNIKDACDISFFNDVDKEYQKCNKEEK